MSGAQSRLSKLASHFLSSSPPTSDFQHRYNIHSLSPTFFLPRAAAIEPDVGKIHTITSPTPGLDHGSLKSRLSLLPSCCLSTYPFNAPYQLMSQMLTHSYIRLRRSIMSPRTARSSEDHIRRRRTGQGG